MASILSSSVPPRRLPCGSSTTAQVGTTAKAQAIDGRSVQSSESGGPLRRERASGLRDNQHVSTMSAPSLIEAARTGSPIRFSAARPEASENPLAAAVIREALLDPSLRPDPLGLTVVGATITGQLDLSFATVTFPLNFLRCSFDEPPLFQHFKGTHLTLSGCKTPGIRLDSAVFEGRVYLSDGFESVGCVNAAGVIVRDSLNCSGAALKNGVDVALILVDAQIDGQAVFLDGFSCDGQLLAVGMRVGGLATFEGSSFECPEQVALALDRASFAQLLNLSSVSCKGIIRGAGIQVAGQLLLRGSEIRATGGLPGLILEGAAIGDNVLLDEGFRCEVGVSAGRLTTPAHIQVEGHLPDLNLQMARIGALHIDLRSVEVLDLTYAVVRTLSAEREPLIQTQLLALPSVDDSPPEEVKVALVAAGIQTKFKAGAWPYGRLRCLGWDVQDLYGDLQDRNFIAAWIDSGEDASPQPWHKVADIYARGGRLSDATWLRWSAARRTTKEMAQPTKTARLLYSAFAGYGYYPLLALLWLIGATLVAALLLVMSEGSGWSGGSSAPAGVWIYAMATVVPSATVSGVGELVVSAPWLVWSLNGLRTFGWFQTAILLAGVTGLLRKT